MVIGAEIQYRIDSNDEIVQLSPEWDIFAGDNDGSAVFSAHVLHRPLWDFICDSTSRQIYRDVLKHVRGGQQVRFNFRCDSPELRRLLEMRIEMGPEETVLFSTHTLSEEMRPAPLLLMPDVERSDEFVRVCSWCEKVFAVDSWVEVEVAVNRLRIFEQPQLPMLTHGICESCAGRIGSVLNAF